MYLRVERFAGVYCGAKSRTQPPKGGARHARTVVEPGTEAGAPGACKVQFRTCLYQTGAKLTLRGLGTGIPLQPRAVSHTRRKSGHPLYTKGVARVVLERVQKARTSSRLATPIATRKPLGVPD